nr:tRNA pseudouridine(55) synthase TruB [candidate division Zixibacteria bacterium]
MIQYDGILLCDKPYGMTSHRVIDILRQTIGQKKIGHTGTLDPRAIGLLLICLGRATKISQFLGDLDKTYEAEITLGVRSSTYDSEGIIPDENPKPVPSLTSNEIEKILSEFKGLIRQKVPAFSAVKVDGQKLYKLARKGKKINPPEKEIEIKDISLTRWISPLITCRVTCSKGTYIRSLANDIGEKIGCGAYLSRLSRTRIGTYGLKEALTLTEIKHYREAGALKKHLRPIEDVLSYPSLKTDETFSAGIVSGRPLHRANIIEFQGDFEAGQLICLKDHGGRIMAVGKSDINSGELRNHDGANFFNYVRVLN